MGRALTARTKEEAERQLRDRSRHTQRNTRSEKTTRQRQTATKTRMGEDTAVGGLGRMRGAVTPPEAALTSLRSCNADALCRFSYDQSVRSLIAAPHTLTTLCPGPLACSSDPFACAVRMAPKADPPAANAARDAGSSPASASTSTRAASSTDSKSSSSPQSDQRGASAVVLDEDVREAAVAIVPAAPGAAAAVAADVKVIKPIKVRLPVTKDQMLRRVRTASGTDEAGEARLRC